MRNDTKQYETTYIDFRQGTCIRQTKIYNVTVCYDTVCNIGKTLKALMYFKNLYIYKG